MMCPLISLNRNMATINASFQFILIYIYTSSSFFPSPLFYPVQCHTFSYFLVIYNSHIFWNTKQKMDEKIKLKDLSKLELKSHFMSVFFAFQIIDIFKVIFYFKFLTLYSLYSITHYILNEVFVFLLILLSVS